ncbi:hypothetical protein BJX70DRAFT_367823 [Aspergillus crustosus]
MVSSAASLPVELLLQIIEELIPSKTAIFAPNHPVTRTLHSLTLIKLTYPLAKRLLLTHCVHLNSLKRLHRFNTSISQHNAEQRAHIHSVHLRPFHHRNEVTYTAATQIDTLISLLGRNLRRLVLEMPFQGFKPEIDVSNALSFLPNLEEFCSIRDDFPLYTAITGNRYTRETWTTWPRLKRLALYRVDINEAFVAALNRVPSLTHLVLTQPGGLDAPLPRDVAETLSWKALQRVLIISGRRGEFWKRSPDNPVLLRYWYANSFLARLVDTYGSLRDGSVVERQLLHLSVMAGGHAEVDVDPALAVYRDHALNGTLWDCQGQVYRPQT